jgi:hypothetical protein
VEVVFDDPNMGVAQFITETDQMESFVKILRSRLLLRANIRKKL